MFKFSNHHPAAGRVVPLVPTDEYNEPLVPSTVAEACGVEQPAPAPEPQAAEKPKADPAMRLLSVATAAIVDAPAPNETLRSRKSAILGEIFALSNTMAAFLADATSTNMVSLKERHATLRAECRAQLDEVRKLARDLPGLEGVFRNAQTTTSRCRAGVQAWLGAEPPARDFPTDAEVQAWRHNLAGAQKQLAEAEAAENRVAAEYNDLAGKVRTEQTKLNELSEQESNTRAELEGIGRIDKALGLLVPPPEQQALSALIVSAQNLVATLTQELEAVKAKTAKHEFGQRQVN
jgi:hypothetical protein